MAAIALHLDGSGAGVFHAHVADRDIPKLPRHRRALVVELGIRVVVIQGEDEGLFCGIANG
ncbi:hypothetical protein D3C80_894600 [compost metagenome]